MDAPLFCKPSKGLCTSHSKGGRGVLVSFNEGENFLFLPPGTLSLINPVPLRLLFSHCHRIRVPLPMHVTPEDNPLAVRCKSYIRFQLVIVFRKIDQFFWLKPPKFYRLAINHRRLKIV